MKQNQIIITILVAVVVGGIGFFGGMQYQKSQVPQRGQFAQMMGGNGANGNFRTGAGRNGANGGAVRGEIVSNDNGTLTVKLGDGSTKLVLLSGNTNISKATAGTKDDLKSGQQVMVIGTTNSDGSVTAQMVSLNPGFGRGTPSAEMSPSPAK